MNNFFKKHISFAGPYGFWFILSCLASAGFFVVFFVLAVNKQVEIDIRIMNLIASFRVIEDANFFLFITYLGDAEIIGSLGLIIGCIMWLLRRHRHSIFVFTGIFLAYIASEIMKLLIHRSRPDVFYALIKEDGFSFPSGHATVSIVFYGTIAYFLYKIVRHRWQKILIVLCLLLLIASIGLSRIYLGVHWFSDVLVGWLLGFSILFFLIAFFKATNMFSEYELKNIPIPIIRRSQMIGAVAAMLFFEGLFIWSYYYIHPLQPPAGLSSQSIVFISHPSDLLKVIESDEFPKFSETITGKKMEPVSFIVVGSLEELSQAFELAGWYESDRRVGTVFRLAFTALFNNPDPRAFITPAFLEAAPDTIAFEKPTALNTVRQRHHARFWTTNFLFQGTPIWVATASFDVGMRYLIAHKISPDIDTERDFIKGDFIRTNFIKNIQEIQLVASMSGKNQIGDEFFTDGRAYLVFLK